jgi:hypothetical protein
MTASAKPKFEELKVGDSLSLAGLFMGVSSEPVKATLSERTDNEIVFDLTYFGISLGTIFAVKDDKKWKWEF